MKNSIFALFVGIFSLSACSSTPTVVADPKCQRHLDEELAFVRASLNKIQDSQTRTACLKIANQITRGGFPITCEANPIPVDNLTARDIVELTDRSELVQLSKIKTIKFEDLNSWLITQAEAMAYSKCHSKHFKKSSNSSDE